MAKSERMTQEWTLASVEIGVPVDVTDILAEDPQPLLVHGLRPGIRLVIERDAPFGGPRIVRIGGRRVAVDRRLAGSMRVRPVADADRQRSESPR